MGALFVATYFNEVRLDHLQNSDSLFDRAVAYELLKEVVSVLVFHQLSHVLADLVKQELNYGRSGFNE